MSNMERSSGLSDRKEFKEAIGHLVIPRHYLKRLPLDWVKIDRHL